MAPTLIEKYRKILAADPRSRIFVELARALLDQGDAAEAIEICRRGLEYHPSSILGRVTWGRALLSSGDLAAAQDQFEIAIGIDPANPYGYNLVGEALLRGGLGKEALPALTRAVELQPADPKVRGWLEEARRRVQGGTVPAMAAAVDPAPPSPAPPRAETATGLPAQPPGGAARPSTGKPRPTQLSMALPEPGAGQEAAAADEAPPLGPDVAAAAPEAAPAEGPSPTPIATELYRIPDRAADPDATEEMTLDLALEAMAEEGGPVPAPPAAPPGPGATAAPEPPAVTPPAPPLLERRAPKKGPPGPRTLLTLIPPAGAAAEPPAGRSTPSSKTADAAEATRIALEYEQHLRERAATEAARAEPPKSRHGGIIAAVALAVVAGSAVGAYLYVNARARNEAAATALEAARAGLARDTRGSLQKAAEVLAARRDAPPSDAALAAQVEALSAEVAALLAADHGDEEARALALRLAEKAGAGEAALVVRWLLAASASDRTTAGDALLQASTTAGPLVQRLAGQALLARGQAESGRGRLQLAARATPPLLGALADLGDSHLAAGDPEGALPYFEAALSAHPTHPRAAIGAAEARLALERPLDGSQAQLAAVAADPGSAPPLATRLRYELASARVLAAAGDAIEASRRLALAAGALGDSAGLEAARAGLLLDARQFAEAAEAAARAVRLEPKVPEHKVVLARARLGQHRPREALAAVEGLDTRTAWLVRGAALLQAGQAESARGALEKTVRDRKMTTEAATLYALGDLALGRTDRALAQLEKLDQAPTAGALQHAALGRALLAAKRPEDAESACRRAAGRDARSPEGPRCLGLVLLAGGRKAEAATALAEAVALDPADPEAARALAAAKATARPPPPPPKAAPKAAAKPAPKKK